MSQTKTLNYSAARGRIQWQYFDETARNGECVGYHPNGQLQFKYLLLNGEIDGVCQCWHDNGQICAHDFYQNGKKYRVSREWYSNGNLKTEAQYHHNLLSGYYKAWHENGQIALEETYVDGVINGVRTKYYSNGVLKFTGLFNAGKASGIHKTWYETGLPCLEEVYKEGKLHSLRTQWFPNGNKELITYRNGFIHGIRKKWNSQGRLISENNCMRNELHGVSLYWHQNGQLRIREQYFRGTRHGVRSEYDEKGDLLEKIVFIRGVIISHKLNNLIKSGNLNADYILNEPNAEVRRICIEELGYAKFLSQVTHKILDREDEYELIRIDISPIEEPIFLVKVKCPSTGAFYTLRVPPTMRTVKEAVAWTFGVEEDKYNPEVET